MKTFAALTSAAALLTGAAIAGEMTDYDTDGDGLLSLEEVQTAKPEVTEDAFNSFDEDGDGFLNEDEYDAWKESMKEDDDMGEDDMEDDSSY